jgi:cell surface protein SprA
VTNIHKRTYRFITALAVFALYSVVWALPVPRDHYYAASYEEPEPTYANNFAEEEVEFPQPEELIIDLPVFPPDTGDKPIIEVPQPDNNPLNEDNPSSPFLLHDPTGVGTHIEYNPTTNSYDFQYMTGNTPYGPAGTMDLNEYIKYDLRHSIKDYWKNKGAKYAGGPNARGSGLIPQIKVGGEVFETIFGSNIIDIRPSGSAELIFGIIHQNNKNPNLPVKQRRRTDFNFDENIQLNLSAKIGDKIEFNLNYNTEATFDWEGEKLKLKYEGKEDDILQLLEFGNITMPLNSTLITGSQTLFGAKTALKFGNLTITAVASEKQSESKSITISGGAQKNEFYFKADEYDENKHFFLGQFFRDHYNQYLETLPLVGSPIVITKIEVWRTTIGSATNENRNIIAFTDLGESSPSMPTIQRNPEMSKDYPDNITNNLIMGNNYSPAYLDSSQLRDISTVSNYLRSKGMVSGTDFEKVESARLLSPSEYTFNSKLGFISLNSALSADQVLAVAFQYTVIGDEHIYQVGEFSNEVAAPNCIRAKLLKSTNLNTKSPLWKLMMKNVYSLNAYQVAEKDFRLNVLYTGDDEGIPNGFFNKGSQSGIPLIRLLGLDHLNQQKDPVPDGIFDFIDGAATLGGTISANNGKIYFPTVEPFGKDLRAVLTEPEIAEKYAFDSLYTMTKTMAQEFTSKNKYYIEGTYSSSYGSEFSLNTFNVPEGSVKVVAGGLTLTENVDYTVNYSMGTVSIINEGVLNSGTPITITMEDKNNFAVTKQRMFGTTLDYRFSDNFNIGAVLMNLYEKPYTQKVNYGNEPINNLVWGMNLSYRTKLPFITKFVDFLPFHSTTTESNFSVDGEFAHFVPGHSRAIGKEGTTYIDDFESTKSTVDLRTFTNWVLASTPQGQPNLFPEANTNYNESERRQLAYGYNRAKLAWYIIDPLFYNHNAYTPAHLTKEDLSLPYSRAVYEPELFPYKERESSAQSTYISVFNLAFYPTERGPYNYDVDGSEGLSRGVNEDGSLKDPKTRWGGIMRKMDNTDFESSNYEYIEFWMMDPFIENPNHSGGKLYFNLGDISEDILRDGKKFFENGLPVDGSDQDVEYTVWGRVPTSQMIVNAFDKNSESRQHQDVGYDGLGMDQERMHFSNYLDRMANTFGIQSPAYQNAIADPSTDNYHYFRGTDYDEMELGITERYHYYNNPEGNSPTDEQSPESYPTSATSLPNVEDVNNDNTLSDEEKYYQYVIDLAPDKMVVGQNYINDIYEATPEALPNGTSPKTKWYQFRIPIKDPDKVVGAIQGFNSIRFMRVFMRDFSEPIICRLATFELVRADWRTYNKPMFDEGDYVSATGDDHTSFYVGTISYEENANRVPIPYVLPPGIEREQGYGGTQVYLTNEQALTMKVVDLTDGDARSIYKNTDYDLRQFKRLKMFVHAEDVYSSESLRKGDVTVFLRLGSDFTDNYYEYEIPVEITPWGVGDDPERIWPYANQLDLLLDSLVSVKMERNIAVRNNLHPSAQVPYYYYRSDGAKITVVGTPNLAKVTTIMIGVRNPKKQSLNDGDDMRDKSVEVWVNELRLCGFDKKSGVAAIANMRLNLADVGDFSVSTSYSSSGYGTLDQSVTEVKKEASTTVDIATNIDAGKVIFPDKWNVKIPVHYDYSLNVVTPEYNPLNPDVKLKDDLRTYNTAQERDSIRKMTTSRIIRHNVNLMNIRKERNYDKPIKIRPWDIENFDISYSYSQVKKSDVDVEMDNAANHFGEIGYTYNNTPKNIRPFAKSKKLNSKWLQLIKDFNFNPLPKVVNIRTSITRELNAFKYRPKSQGNIIIDTSYIKTFNWARNYTVNWDLAQSLRLEYTANVLSRIDEPDGLIDTKAKKDSVWKSFGKGGRTNNFYQRINASWQIPINKFPLFNWINANIRYTGDFTFTGSTLALANLGNVIQNSNSYQGTANVNLVTLYNNIPYLKKVNQGQTNSKGKNAKDDDKGKNKKDESKEDNDKDKKKGGKKKGKDTRDSLKKDVNVGKIILDGSLRFLMMLRNVSVNYTLGNGSLLPGYMYSPNILGLNVATKGSPGFLYVFGGQTDIQRIAAERNWLTTDSLMNSAFQKRRNETFNYRVTVEPFKDFRIDVTGNLTKTNNFTEYFRAFDDGHVEHYTPITTGNFSMTFVGLATFFKKGDDVFATFMESRHYLAEKIAANNPNSQGIDPETGYPDGYNGIAQEVLTNALLSAYGGRKVEKMNVKNTFPKFPLPNWRINYNGLTKIKKVNKVFQSFSINHAYTSNYTVGGFTTNSLYREDADGNSMVKNTLGNFIPKYEFTQVSISEQFAPLIGIDMTFKNSLLLKVEYKQARNVSLSFTNNQITETTSSELTCAAGYRFKDIKIGFVFSGMKRQVVSDLNLTAGFGMKKNMTILRKIVENENQVTAGMLTMTINVAADYQISSRVGLKFYYDQVINRPEMTNQYDNMNFETGISVRLMLTN